MDWGRPWPWVRNLMPFDALHVADHRESWMARPPKRRVVVMFRVPKSYAREWRSRVHILDYEFNAYLPVTPYLRIKHWEE
jgi:hypothetical protein